MPTGLALVGLREPIQLGWPGILWFPLVAVVDSSFQGSLPLLCSMGPQTTVATPVLSPPSSPQAWLSPPSCDDSLRGSSRRRETWTLPTPPRPPTHLTVLPRDTDYSEGLCSPKQWGRGGSRDHLGGTQCLEHLLITAKTVSTLLPQAHPRDSPSAPPLTMPEGLITLSLNPQSSWQT